MRNECRAALKYIIDLHAKQRSQLYATHATQREVLAREVSEYCASPRYAVAAVTPSLL